MYSSELLALATELLANRMCGAIYRSKQTHWESFIVPNRAMVLAAC